jgi:hypothetical protein
MGIKDKRFFDGVWSVIISTQIPRFVEEPGVSYVGEDVAKPRMRDAYNRLNDHVSASYMRNPGGELNRRKVAACFMYAICASRPFNIDWDVVEHDEQMTNAHSACFSNERLAIVCGCSVLISFLRRAVEDYSCATGLSEAEERELYERLDRGVDFLESVDGGEYLLNLERALSLTVVEGNYNVPILGCMIAYWERQLFDDHVNIYRGILDQIRKHKGYE